MKKILSIILISFLFLWSIHCFGVSDTFAQDITVVNFFPFPSGYGWGYARDIAWDGSSLWIAENATVDIYEIDPSDGSVISSFYSPAFNPWGLAWDSTNLRNAEAYTGIGTYPDYVYTLSTTGTNLGSWLAPTSPNAQPHGLTYDPDSSTLWMSDSNTNTLYELNPLDGTVLSSFGFPGTDPRGLGWDGQYILAIDNSNTRLYRLDTTGNVIDNFSISTLGNDPEGLAWDGQYAWITENQNDRIYQISIPSVPRLSLSQTGQTTSYYTGDDGEIQAGLPWPSPRFTDNTDGTITDNLTGLMWTQDTNAPGPVGCSPGIDKSWQAALDHIACLNTNNYLGHTDWRLPNINELETLINAEINDLSTWLISQGFTNILTYYAYWSSTTDAANTGYAFALYLTGVTAVSGKTGYQRVWPVRGTSTGPAAVWQTGQTTIYYAGDDGNIKAGVPWPLQRFKDNGDGTVTDNLTGLMWLQDANCINTHYSGFDADNTAGDGRVTWEHALDFIAGINDGTYPNCGAGYTDWRLSNRRELQSLTDFSTYYPALQTGNPFSNVQSYWYWASNTYVTTYDAAIAQSVGIGYQYIWGKIGDFNVWPVRSGIQIQPKYKISGKVMTTDGLPMENVRVTLSGDASDIFRTDSLGRYRFRDLPNGTYTVTPTIRGYTFSPVNRVINISGANVTNQHFTGSPLGIPDVYSISGRIISTLDRTPLAGVTIHLDGPVTGVTTTDARGIYRFTGLFNGTYTVVPYTNGFIIFFTPQSRSVTISGANVKRQNFRGTPGP